MTPNEIKTELAEYNSLVLQQKQIVQAVKIKRTAIQEGCFGMQAPDQEGTETCDVFGCIVKLTSKLTRTLTKDGEAIQEALGRLQSEASKERIITFKPAMSLAEYRKLDSHDKNVIDELITVKLGSPTLTIEGDFTE